MGGLHVGVVVLDHGTEKWHHNEVNTKQLATLAHIFERPTRADLRWADVEQLFAALGADIEEGRGSRVRVALNGMRASFHRPHPRRIAGRALVDDVRRFLQLAEIEP